jgi:hypothetical protein
MEAGRPEVKANSQATEPVASMATVLVTDRTSLSPCAAFCDAVVFVFGVNSEQRFEQREGIHETERDA